MIVVEELASLKQVNHRLNISFALTLSETSAYSLHVHIGWTDQGFSDLYLQPQSLGLLHMGSQSVGWSLWCLCMPNILRGDAGPWPASACKFLDPCICNLIKVSPCKTRLFFNIWFYFKRDSLCSSGCLEAPLLPRFLQTNISPVLVSWVLELQALVTIPDLNVFGWMVLRNKTWVHINKKFANIVVFLIFIFLMRVINYYSHCI